MPDTAVLDTPAPPGTPCTALVQIFNKADIATNLVTQIAEQFSPIFLQADAVIADAKRLVVTDATQVSEMKAARQARLTLKDIRVRGGKVHKGLKADALKYTQTLDLVNRTLNSIIEPEEARLEDLEKFAERAEAKRKAELRANREAMLRPYEVDTTYFNLAEMPESQFANLLNTSKTTHELRQEEARKAEEDHRAAEAARAAEEARVREENTRLRREAEEREAATRAERDRLEAEARKEREAREAAEAEARRARHEQERREREAREAEERLRAEEAAAQRRAALAPDKDKVRALAATLGAVQLPEVSSAEAQAIVAKVRTHLERMVVWLNDQAETLG
jgi:hypothetical protein